MRYLFATIVLLFSTTCFAGDDWDTSYESSRVQSSSDNWHLVVGINYRVDEERYIDQSPSPHLGLRWSLLGPFALVGDLEYAPSSNTTSDVYTAQKLHILSLSGGIRLQETHARVAPFGEFKWNTSQYTGTVGENLHRSHGESGIELAGGVVINLVGRYGLEMSLNHLINHSDVIYIVDPLSPYPPGRPFGSIYEISQKYYNPTSIALSLRIAL